MAQNGRTNGGSSRANARGGVSGRNTQSDNKSYKSNNSNNKSGSNGAAKSGRYRAEVKSAPPSREKSRFSVFFRGFFPFILLIAAILVTVSFLVKDFGVVGNFLRDNVLFGLFSSAAYMLPAIFAACAIFMLGAKHVEHSKSKTVCVAILYVTLCALFHVLFSGNDTLKTINPAVHYSNGMIHKGGGAVGGFFGALLSVCFSGVGAGVILVAAVIILVLVIFGRTPKEIWDAAAERQRARREERQRYAEGEGDEYIPERSVAGGFYEEDDEYYGSDDVYTAPKSDGKGAKNNKNIKRKMTVSAEPEIYGAVKEEAAADGTERAASKRKALDLTAADDDFPDENADGLDGSAAGYDDRDNAPFDESDSHNSDNSDNSDKFDDSYNSYNGDGRRTIEADYEMYSADSADSAEDESLFEDPEDEELVKRLSRYYLENEPLEVKERVVSGLSSKSPAEIRAAKKAAEPSDNEKKAPAPSYFFPDISLLTEDKGKHDTDCTNELRTKEAKLIETLEKFNVHTDSAGLPSKGPTITRYELRPAPGTRVRAIVNLVDDIALSLATSGIRIEAPIPGKSAVGIEVPNDVRETVRLRSLIDTEEFRSAKSRLNVALGEDVAGEPVYFDIAKMPHLLIAGATGMGKSVCINCLLISLLYKSTPDEVRLILIDPKKVEFSMYGDLPHLLVPVVSDPKKAAGALSWAVSEMERRFALIDGAGVRNIFGYNDIASNDPTMERLSQIVIIIDELADLMMTAPDSVEDSVCRLAQKARAAGMHLVIGTQRPSVDVITGTIKSNIPSRIAFTVASQIDSRTIIDTAGAEKLIGRGDMLFNPVGATKPIRVQGAFVEDGEVERVVEFIKEKNSENENGYSDDVMTQIESEAAKCVSKKRSGSSYSEESGPALSYGDEDPMFYRALELAVETGKISTSLIQRKCSLGFGRAAKLIDKMENLGYVSAPDGQKPRQVRLTREQLDEILASKNLAQKSEGVTDGGDGGDGEDDEGDDAPF